MTMMVVLLEVFVVVIVVATTTASATSTSTSSTATAPLIYHYHRPIALFSSGGVIIPKHRRTSGWRRRDRIRPRPGWHPCAESRDNDSDRYFDGSGSIVSSTAVMANECAEDIPSTIIDGNNSNSNISGDDEDENDNTTNKNDLEEETKSRQQQQQQQKLASILILLTVPAAWGTYAPAVKFIYNVADGSSSSSSGSNPPSMPGLVFSAGYYCVAALTLGMLSFWNDQQTDNVPEVRVREYGQVVGQWQQTHLDDFTQKKDEDEVSSRGGWELGSYLFIGNALQVAGLQTVPADRAAFLVQLTTVMVPLLSAVSAGKLSAVTLKTWAACAVAFAGVVVMGADNAGDSGSMTLDLADKGNDNGTLSHLLHSLSGGDVLIVLAAFAYSLHVLRLGAYAPRTAPLRLAAAKAKAETVFSVSVVLLLACIGGGGFAFFLPEFIVKSGDDVSKYFSWLASDRNAIDPLLPSIGAILWTGWVTCAYTIYAQSFGQRHVNPTDANLIYATQPLFTSLIAYFLLGETLGPNGFIGAALIGTALGLVST